LNGRADLFAIADDVKILVPPATIRELAESFPTFALEEAGLTSVIVKKCIFVQQSARAE
jgi:hypothetical protein